MAKKSRKKETVDAPPSHPLSDEAALPALDGLDYEAESEVGEDLGGLEGQDSLSENEPLGVDVELASDIDGLGEASDLEGRDSLLPVWPPASEAMAPASPDMLQRYLWEVRQYPLLSREEEDALTKRFHDDGDPEAAARLVTSNLRLVVKIAMEHQRYWMRNLLDLVQEGNVGLLQAVKKFDPFRGIKFSYYASFWIKAYILKFIMDNWRLVRLGTTQAQRKLFYNLRREKEKLLSQGIVAGPALLSSRLGVREQDVVDMEQRLDSWELSLDAPVREDSEDSHQSFMPDDRISAEESLAGQELRRLFHQQLDGFRQTLDDKERAILDQRLLSEQPVTLSDLGQEHGISRERVRQIQERLLQKLRRHLREQIPNFDEQFMGLAEGE